MPQLSRDLAALFQRHGAMVFQRARRILGSDEDAEEAMQEVFLRVLRKSEPDDPRASDTTWLYQITTNYCLNQLRDRTRRRELLDKHLPSGEERSTTSEPADFVFLRRLLAEADPQQAQAAMYVLVDGMSHDEAAPLLKVSPRTVSNLVSRFERWAQSRVAELHPDGETELPARAQGGRP